MRAGGGDDARLAGSGRDGDPRLRLGISACLLGEPVRYDQDHRRDRWIVEVLGRWAWWVPVCPEMESGLGAPRPTIRLERTSDGVRAVAPETGEDLTDRLRRHAAGRAPALLAPGLDGFVLKSRSPSCGPEGLVVYEGDRTASRDGTGLFAEALRRLDPGLPCIDEAGLRDRAARAAFLAAAFARNRRRASPAGESSLDGTTDPEARRGASPAVPDAAPVPRELLEGFKEAGR